MRIALLTAVGLSAGLIVSATPGPAHADQYKWCAMYNGGETGASANCYFVALQQCQWAV